MPIRKDLRHHYEGPEWEAIRAAILERAGHRCEQCRKPDRTDVEVDEKGHWRDASEWYWHDERGERVNYRARYARLSRVVLTVAHLNHEPTDNRPENLRGLCQRCHLAHDAPLHRRNAAATRWKKRNNLEFDLRTQTAEEA